MAIEAITVEQSNDFNAWLSEHNLCKKASKKRMRIYRKVANSRRIASRDFVYVVSADEYRADLDAVHNTLIEKSMKVMDDEERVKNKEYIDRMNQVEEDLLMNHGIEMNWTNAKSVSFKKIVHIIKEPEILRMLDEAAKEHKNYDVNNVYLERFRMGAIIEEFGIAPQYDWKYFNVIVKAGKVICAYSYKDLIKLDHKTFKTGIFDKFGYNLGICDDATIQDVIEKSHDLDEVIAANA